MLGGLPARAFRGRQPRPAPAARSGRVGADNPDGSGPASAVPALAQCGTPSAFGVIDLSRFRQHDRNATLETRLRGHSPIAGMVVAVTMFARSWVASPA